MDINWENTQESADFQAIRVQLTMAQKAIKEALRRLEVVEERASGLRR